MQSLGSSSRGPAWPAQEFVKAVGDDSTVGTAAVIVEEDHGRVFCPLVGGGDPVPRIAAGGSKAKPGPQLLFVGQFVQGLGVERLETIDRPTFRPPAFLARLFEFEAGGLDGGSVPVQLEKSFRQKFA